MACFPIVGWCRQNSASEALIAAARTAMSTKWRIGRAVNTPVVWRYGESGHLEYEAFKGRGAVTRRKARADGQAVGQLQWPAAVSWGKGRARHREIEDPSSGPAPRAGDRRGGQKQDTVHNQRRARHGQAETVGSCLCQVGKAPDNVPADWRQGRHVRRFAGPVASLDHPDLPAGASSECLPPDTRAQS